MKFKGLRRSFFGRVKDITADTHTTTTNQQRVIYSADEEQIVSQYIDGDWAAKMRRPDITIGEMRARTESFRL